MPLLSIAVLGIFWTAWFYPFFFRAPHWQKRESITRSRPTAAGLFLETASIFIALAAGWHSNVQAGYFRFALAIVVGGASIAMAWSAVKHLGRQFRVNAGLYEDHELVTTGAYSIVRHPIYCALLGMLLFTLLLVAPWQRMLVPIFVMIAGMEIRVRTEDALLESRFGESFRQYRARVSAYVPFVR